MSHARADAWARLVAAAPANWVLDHARAVEGLAVAMARAAKASGNMVDEPLVSMGALLHDIGRSVSHGVDHASIGARILREDHWPPPLVDIVERHTGAGIDEAEAAQLGLPVKDYTPRTLEERLVAHADNLLSGVKRLDLGQVLEKYHAQGLDDAGAKIERLHRELGQLLHADLDALAPVELAPPESHRLP